MSKVGTALGFRSLQEYRRKFNGVNTFEFPAGILERLRLPRDQTRYRRLAVALSNNFLSVEKGF